MYGCTIGTVWMRITYVICWIVETIIFVTHATHSLNHLTSIIVSESTGGGPSHTHNHRSFFVFVPLSLTLSNPHPLTISLQIQNAMIPILRFNCIRSSSDAVLGECYFEIVFAFVFVFAIPKSQSQSLFHINCDGRTFCCNKMQTNNRE